MGFVRSAGGGYRNPFDPLSVAVVCGVGADVAYHRHVMGLYVT